jgi:alanyl aminopeptidase
MRWVGAAVATGALGVLAIGALPSCAQPSSGGARAPAPAPLATAAASPRVSAPPPRADGRLPDTARPSRYALDLRIDPAAERYSGVARIDVTVPKPTRDIVLHARELAVTRAVARSDAGERTASVSYRRAHGASRDEELVLTFVEPLAEGAYSLVLEFEARFDPSLSGLYRVRDNGLWYAFTQFEATDARRAFPCFDEPAFKVPWDVQITVPRGLTAVANTRERARRDEGDRTVIAFETTAPLPSYLVAFAVGDLEFRDATKASAKAADGRAAPAPIRLVTTKGKAALGARALEQTALLVRALEGYFDRPYPFDKLDIVAVPEFGAGAMENPGLVTFREELLLLGEQASARAKKAQTVVIAHELAHQWFGDLVTMEWWDDLWLNEGFASWMEAKIVDQTFPGFGASDDLLLRSRQVMDIDALGSARAVRQPVRTPAEASEAFDGLTYSKGAAVLAMTEAWLGEDVFQRGVRSYVERFGGKNAKADDLFAELERASGRDVRRVVSAFLDETGVPRIDASLRCTTGRPAALVATRTRWAPAHGEPASSEAQGASHGPTHGASRGPSQGPGAPRGRTRTDAPWLVPLCASVDGAAALCAVAGDGETAIPLTKACPKRVLADPSGVAYARIVLAPELRKSVLEGAKGLHSRAKIALVSDLWASVKSGDLNADELLDALVAFDGEGEKAVIEGIIDVLSQVDQTLVADATRDAFHAYARARLASYARTLSRKPKRSGDLDGPLAEAMLLLARGELGGDPKAFEEAESMARRWLSGSREVDPDLAAAALELASRRAGEERLEALRTAVKQASLPQERLTALRGLYGFSDPRVLRRALDLITTEDIKRQDLRYVIHTALAHAPSRPVVLTWLEERWPDVRARLPGGMSRRLVQIAAGLCTDTDVAHASRFFEGIVSGIDGAKRPLAEALETASRCVALRRAQAGRAADYLARRPGNDVRP